MFQIFYVNIIHCTMLLFEIRFTLSDYRLAFHFTKGGSETTDGIADCGQAAFAND